MRRSEVELLDRDLDDEPTLAISDLGLAIDRDDAGELGFRALYEHPETILRGADHGFGRSA
jgi:hypothetical protein